jgi:hypothetical protein
MKICRENLDQRGEIPDNGIDDDQNGYIDDVHGWNFIGGADGKNIGADSLEVAREVSRLKNLKSKETHKDMTYPQRKRPFTRKF